MQILVYGYGNPGRQDDGLGVALVEKLESWAAERQLTGISFENNYQLNIEDAEAISDKDLVIFVDASREDIDDFCLTEVDGSGKLSFTTHAASPDYIVKLCRELFDSQPRALLLHIKGYEWDLKEGLTEPARDNLEKAEPYLQNILEDPQPALASQERLKTC
ncbi:MAG: hydrogenase maturation protease [Anaerolineales bacterium]|nr:hydrogenase maturation protease [Anaerolineales bacterium]MBS3752750.1 hydrogenase maturation protease [Anaerolineales bacterium]